MAACGTVVSLTADTVAAITVTCVDELPHLWMVAVGAPDTRVVAVVQPPSESRPSQPAQRDTAALRAADVTPRGWLVGCVVATVVLGLLASGIGALVPGRSVPGPAGDPAHPGNGNPEATPAPTRTTSGPAAPSSSAEPKSTPSNSKPATVPRHGPGTYQRATVRLANSKPQGRVIRYAVRVEDGVQVDPDKAATIIHRVLNDERSWSGDGSVTWVFVPSGEVELTASITTPDTTDRICRPLNTRGKVSCRNQENIALNALRWTRGVPHYDGDLVGYRQYLVNHEFGHFIGYDHVGCPGKGKNAPVMMTQTISLGECKKNPWPANDP